MSMKSLKRRRTAYATRIKLTAKTNESQSRFLEADSADAVRMSDGRLFIGRQRRGAP